MSCDVGEMTERLKIEQSFTYDTAHSPTLPLLHQRHSSFSKPSFASPTSQALHLRTLAMLMYEANEHVLVFLQRKADLV